MINTIYAGDGGSLCRKKITGGKDLLGLPPPRWKQSRLPCPADSRARNYGGCPATLPQAGSLVRKLSCGPSSANCRSFGNGNSAPNRKISDIDNEIARISEQNLVLVRLKSKGYVDSALYLSQMDEIDHKLRELRKLRRRLLEAAGEDRQIHEHRANDGVSGGWSGMAG